MKHQIGLLILLILVLFASIPAFAQDAQHGNSKSDPPMLGLHWAKGQAPSRGGGSPNLVYHSGPIMTDAVVTPIFWGGSWGNANFVGDKIDGLATFYRGMSGSNYAGTCNEFSDSSGAQVTSSIGYNGYILDPSTAPNTGNSTSAILAEVCKVIQSPQSNGYYPVYIDAPRHGSYCAWHSYGSCKGTTVQFAFFYNLDGDSGCDPQDTSKLHSQGLAALANVSGHELSEARTDPRLNAWYDSSGEENSDKCSWTYGHSLLTFSQVDGVQTKWKVQGNWSNAAYNSQSGYDSKKGCIDGGSN